MSHCQGLLFETGQHRHVRFPPARSVMSGPRAQLTPSAIMLHVACLNNPAAFPRDPSQPRHVLSDECAVVGDVRLHQGIVRPRSLSQYARDKRRQQPDGFRHTHSGAMIVATSTVRSQTNRNVREPPVIIFLTRGVPTTRSKRPASIALYRTLTCNSCNEAMLRGKLE